MAERKKDFEKQVLEGIAKISNKLIDHDDRFEIFESNLKDFMLTHFDRIYSKLEKLEDEYKLLNAAVKRLEERMDKLEGRMSNVEERLGGIEEKMVTPEEIAEVKKQVLDLLGRIEKLEAKVKV